ncbi:MAG TPA: PIG-L deacetylase family protein [Vicinamibacterales bacterium]|nr:PIG-L deacetylase family protein [Vicinamibacterales bacterium]
MTAGALRLMAVLAHPDDESLGMGGVLARYAQEGIDTFVLTATRGQRGRFFDNSNRPDDDAVGSAREGELRNAARELGVREVTLLDYRDGDLDRADPREAAAQIAVHLRRVRPHVVLTFDPFGAYGHPDHIAICQFTTAALVLAADAAFTAGGPPHRVAKLYYMVNDEAKWEAYQAAFKRLVSRVDGVERAAIPWPDWSITTRIDTRAQWPIVWRAVQCHRTQNAIYARLDSLTEADHHALWGSQAYYRVFSTVNGGRQQETDLFAGLRSS